MTSFKNFWSLNTDEVLVTGMLRNFVAKDVQVLMPLNAQLKDVDLVAMNMKTKKSITIQVKGSRAYIPSKKEVERYGTGSTCWFLFLKNTVHSCTADYFIFVLYANIADGTKGRRSIEAHAVTVKPTKLSKLCAKYKAGKKGDSYDFAIWIDPTSKRVFDFRTDKGMGKMNLAQFLDERGFSQITRRLK